MARRDSDLQTISSEGGLLPPDLLRKVLDPQAKLEGTSARDYGLPPGERLNEGITQSWNRLRKHWAEFRAAARNLPAGEPGTGLTNDKWSVPLLRELSFGLLPASTAPTIDGKAYAINRFFGGTAIHLIGCGLSLDRRAAGVRGAAAANPHGLVQDFLNRSDGHLWAILSNGLRLRILRDTQAISRQSYLEFDLEAMFDGEVFSDFVILWLVAHATRFAAREDGRPESCWLERWTKIAEEQGTRALGELQGGVEKALQILGQGFVGHPKNAALRDALRTGQLTASNLHGQLLRIVYRLIFLFVAEDRTPDGVSLLHSPDNSDSACIARERYAIHYSAARLRRLAGDIRGSRHGDLWWQFNLVVGALSDDERFNQVREKLCLPILGSFLWSADSTAALNATTLAVSGGAELANTDFLEAIQNLAFTRQHRHLRPVDYKNLGAEELGGVYESLLALTPQVSGDGAKFTFAEFAGNERKTSGAYYTPDALVHSLLDSALTPVIEEATKGKRSTQAEEAILELKVCDPAVGSGHFLVGAAHQLALHLARIRAAAQGEGEPSPGFYQHALRDVIGRCLYGVDINPMAAELCRVSLWLEALDPGKPLSFLDHHIRVGNSLLGTTPTLIAGGLPDDAFNAIEVDDKKVCTQLKKRNKAEREGFDQSDLLDVARLRVTDLTAIASEAAALDSSPDDTVDAVHRKSDQFRRLVVSPDFKHAQLVADAWCSAFVWPKTIGTLTDVLSSGTINRLRADANAVTESQSSEIERLAQKYQFFHWHLAFPGVFAKGGFDCVIGNPPWEKVKLQEREFFASLDANIANARTASDRKKLISAHRLGNTREWLTYVDRLRFDAKLSRYYRQSGRYPLTGGGEANTYSLFAELATDLVNPAGTVGQILKTGIVNAVENVHFYQAMVKANRLWSVRDFKNWLGWFPDVGYHERFSLVTITGVGRRVVCSYAFNCLDIAEARDPEKVYALSAEQVALLNPNTPVCPVFSTRFDLAIAMFVYGRFSPLVNERTQENAWGLHYSRMFDMTADSGDFLRYEELLSDNYRVDAGRVMRNGISECVPLLEGKHIQIYTHRFSTFDGIPEKDRFGIKAATTTPEYAQLNDPDYEPLPRYWVRREKWQDACPLPIVQHKWCIAFRDVTNLISNTRTVMSTIAPARAYGNSAALLFSENATASIQALFLVATMNSTPFDYIARQKLFGAHLNKYILWQLAAPNPEAFVGSDRELTALGAFVASRALELSYTSASIGCFAEEFGFHGPPFYWDEARRFLLRAELDAAFFHMYLPSDSNGKWVIVKEESGWMPRVFKNGSRSRAPQWITSWKPFRSSRRRTLRSTGTIGPSFRFLRSTTKYNTR